MGGDDGDDTFRGGAGADRVGGDEDYSVIPVEHVPVPVTLRID